MNTLSGQKQRPAPPRQRMSGEERKAQIVRVATDLFAREGFKGATTREIARKAGISEAVIYKHFSRKEDLYKAIIDSRCSNPGGEPRLLSMLKGKEGKDVFVIIASFLLEEHRRDSSFLRLLMYSALEQQSLSELFINTRGLEFLGFLESHIQSLIKKGGMRKVDPALAARAFIGMVEHYSIAQELYGAKSFFSRPERKVVETFVDIFLNGMKRR
ncbi:MAG: TetR/AcrR family transcriptional regulator [Deltaproteobacteria bacterium]|nr:TetR/AcrR family transcriptional regulator [Deltaproteobacteria bacterium]MBZ0219121.1 TetR/AcrR family transcriptional regulator [Deltaproteobacteria bacterium]